jgi:hypothetical protein
MLRNPFVLVAACVFAVAGNAQSDRPSLETGRRAARCSIVASMAAKAARSPEAREGSITMGRLMEKLARWASSPQQHIAWLDEMEVDLKAADASAMRAMTADCRALIGEQSEALDRILSSEK